MMIPGILGEDGEVGEVGDQGDMGISVKGIENQLKIRLIDVPSL